MVARRAGHGVLIWAHEAEVAAAIDGGHRNDVFLPGVDLDPGIRATGDLGDLRGSELVLLAPPTQHLRGLVRSLASVVPASTPLAICAKGIEIVSGKLPTEIVAEASPNHRQAVLSGPSFAIEVALGQPTAVTLAAADLGLAQRLAETLALPTFRPYASDDPVGAEIGGAVKNVLAIAAGIVEGKGLGDNARAALITRGLAEMVRLGVAKGGRQETLSGLSGLGDLVLTCTGAKSRNHALGVALGRGRSLTEAMPGPQVVEGVSTAAAVATLAADLGIDMPISTAVAAVLSGKLEIDRAIAGLLDRPIKAERQSSAAPRTI
jgi:glycerol-3-phosphate dehydrogenase (NAD(P)+)